MTKKGKTFKAIQAGTGPRGEHWIEAIQQNPDVETVAFVDTNPSTLAEIEHKFNIPKERLFTDLSEAIRVSEADFLIDVTPPQFHGRVSGAAFEAGLHVISQKPMSDDLDEAKQLVNTAKTTGKTYMIIQNYRFKPLPQSIKGYISEGRIGKVEAAVISYYAGMNFGAVNFRSLMEHPMIKDMSIHHFDLMRCYLGKDATTAVYARSYNPSWSWYQGDPTTMMLIDFDDTLVNYHTSWTNIGQGGNDWRFDGSEGSILTHGSHGGLKLEAVSGRMARVERKEAQKSCR